MREAEQEARREQGRVRRAPLLHAAGVQRCGDPAGEDCAVIG